MKDVAFVVMPFASIHRPAIGVSLLKSALTKADISSVICYYNIELARLVGSLYDDIAETSLDSPLIGELIFSKFVHRLDNVRTYSIRQILRAISATKRYTITIDKLAEKIEYIQTFIPEFLNCCAQAVLKNAPKIVGFTSTFEQNCASMALAKTIKELSPAAIIFGGANCEGAMGAAILKCTPWVDYICSGEGDISLVEFIKLGASKGMLSRASTGLDITLTNPVMDMDSLPFPDFDDYFSSSPENPELVLETSRGCWWGEKFHCTFCGLNGSTMKYRSKSVPRVLEEVKLLRNKYKINKFQVVDNIMDLSYIRKLFPYLPDIELFYETKANISQSGLLALKHGGVTKIQPGIESLSDVILKIMKKGTTALQNIQTLKSCRELNVTPLWNFIWGFPGEPPCEYSKMAKLVPLITHLPPPDGLSTLVLDRFSPYFMDPQTNGIKNVRPWIAYKYIYPTLDNQDLYNIAYHFDFDYCDGRDPSSYTAELKRELKIWKSLWQSDPPILNIIDKNHIKDTRPCAIKEIHTLTDEHELVYNFCRTPKSSNGFLNDSEDILMDLIDSKLMINDNGKYLSLALNM